MDLRDAPLLLPTAAFCLGLALTLPPRSATGLAPPDLYLWEAMTWPPGLVVGLVLTALALGRRGLIVVAVAFGLLLGSLRQESARWPSSLDLSRPVEVVVEVDSWSLDEETWWAAGTVLRARQGIEVRPVRIPIYVQVPVPSEREAKERGLGPKAIQESVKEGRFFEPLQEPPVEPGVTLRIRGFVRRSPGFRNQPTIPPGPWSIRAKSLLLVEVEKEPWFGRRLLSRFRSRVEASIVRLEKALVQRRTQSREGPGSGASGESGESVESMERAVSGALPSGLGLPRALVFGDAGRLEPMTERTLRALGLSHLLAVSGLHVGLLATLVYGLSFWMPRPMRMVLVLASVLLYLVLVGPRPALLRSTTMVLAGLAATATGRFPTSRNALALAVAAMLVGEPLLVRNLGFQLSVVATGGLLWLGPLFRRRWMSTESAFSESVPAPPIRPERSSWLDHVTKAVKRTSLATLAASSAAQVAILPWSVVVFGRVTLATVWLQLIVLPWCAALLGSSFLAVLLALVWPSSVAWSSRLIGGLLWPVDALTPMRPQNWWSMPFTGEAWAALLAAAVLGCLFSLRRGWVLTLVLPFLVPVAMTWRQPSWPEAWMLDVGQGDALVLRDRGETWLIDGGGWRSGDFGGRVLVPALAGLGIVKLDGVVATHGDQDHCGGLVDLAAYLPIRHFVLGPHTAESRCGAQLAELAGSRLVPRAAGEAWPIGRWRVEVLHPSSEGTSLSGLRRGSNNGSLVLLASVFGRRLLLTGDIEAAAESSIGPEVDKANLFRSEAWSGSGADLRFDVLKVAHHGSKTSTQEIFLRRLNPRQAWISAGRGNRFGHPSTTVLERLAKHRIWVRRTDQSGRLGVEIRPDGVWQARF